ncbi:TetR family transcriptional regulator [Gordonia iterans]|uniref:TetR family transcriptional regulator n=1 Tax=Gordonia iterans TaxID=1004901 RepID=UPI0038995261
MRSSARELFVRRGFHATSVEHIAQHAGCEGLPALARVSAWALGPVALEIESAASVPVLRRRPRWAVVPRSCSVGSTGAR